MLLESHSFKRRCSSLTGLWVQPFINFQMNVPNDLLFKNVVRLCLQVILHCNVYPQFLIPTHSTSYNISIYRSCNFMLGLSWNFKFKYYDYELFQCSWSKWFCKSSCGNLMLMKKFHGDEIYHMWLTIYPESLNSKYNSKNLSMQVQHGLLSTAFNTCRQDKTTFYFLASFWASRTSHETSNHNHT